MEADEFLILVGSWIGVLVVVALVLWILSRLSKKFGRRKRGDYGKNSARLHGKERRKYTTW